MRVYITQRRLLHEKLGDVWLLEEGYFRFFSSFCDVTSLSAICPYTMPDEKCFGSNSFIILSGGNDINPNLYRESNSESLDVCDVRDAFESRLLEIAVTRRIPVLGVCRGAQLINVFFGGKLLQDLKGIAVQTHVGAMHAINLHDVSLKSKFGPAVLVNSFHNQGIAKESLSKSLSCFASSDQDQLVEGLFHPDYPIAGILWHPERERAAHDFNHFLVESFFKRKLYWK